MLPLTDSVFLMLRLACPRLHSNNKLAASQDTHFCVTRAVPCCAVPCCVCRHIVSFSAGKSTVSSPGGSMMSHDAAGAGGGGTSGPNGFTPGSLPAVSGAAAGAGGLGGDNLGSMDFDIDLDVAGKGCGMLACVSVAMSSSVAMLVCVCVAGGWLLQKVLKLV